MLMRLFKLLRMKVLSWLTIHGRTRAQGFSGNADWNYITDVAKHPPIPVIGNGDLVHSNQVLSLQKQSGCSGMMIGRGCLKNPWIFQKVRKLPVKMEYGRILERFKISSGKFL